MPAMDYAKIATLYDIYARTDIDLPFFLRECQGSRDVLELTSGTGRLSLPLIEAGANLSCLDSSPEMLAILREKLQKKGLSAPIYEMDASNFSLPERFDLIIIPFNAFSEIQDPILQRAALSSIYSHLSEKGRLICTLHNPAVRLKTVDGQIHGRGTFLLPDAAGSLVLSSRENYDANTQLVYGEQFYELYDSGGVLKSKRGVEMCFYLHYPDAFENLVRSQSYQVLSLFGDYDRSEFNPERSPLMIWILGKR
jgi:SAM-dependent methyltransferase